MTFRAELRHASDVVVRRTYGSGLPCYPGVLFRLGASNFGYVNDLQQTDCGKIAKERITWHLGAGGRWFESSRPDHFSSS
jgi:hypothetical protein